MSSNYPGPYDQYANTSWDKAQQPRGLDTPVQEILKFQQRQLQHNPGRNAYMPQTQQVNYNAPGITAATPDATQLLQQAKIILAASAQANPQLANSANSTNANNQAFRLLQQLTQQPQPQQQTAYSAGAVGVANRAVFGQQAPLHQYDQRAALSTDYLSARQGSNPASLYGQPQGQNQGRALQYGAYEDPRNLSAQLSNYSSLSAQSNQNSLFSASPSQSTSRQQASTNNSSSGFSSSGGGGSRNSNSNSNSNSSRSSNSNRDRQSRNNNNSSFRGRNDDNGNGGNNNNNNRRNDRRDDPPPRRDDRRDDPPPRRDADRAKSPKKETRKRKASPPPSNVSSAKSNKAPPRSTETVQKTEFHHSYAVKQIDYLQLKQRHRKLHIPKDFSYVDCLCADLNNEVPTTNFYIDIDCSTKKDEASKIDQILKVDTETASNASDGTVYTSKVMLFAGYKQPYGKSNSHLSNQLKFIVGKKDRSELFCIGGAWSHERDGGDPSVDRSVLKATATHYFKEFTGVDLSVCKEWIHFMDIHYQRPTGTEVSVIWIPCIWQSPLLNNIVSNLASSKDLSVSSPQAISAAAFAPEPSTSLPEASSASVPDPSSASAPEPSSASLPEPSSASVPDPSVPEPSSASTPEASSASVPEPSSASVPEASSASVPEPSAPAPEPSFASSTSTVDTPAPSADVQTSSSTVEQPSLSSCLDSREKGELTPDEIMEDQTMEGTEASEGLLSLASSITGGSSTTDNSRTTTNITEAAADTNNNSSQSPDTTPTNHSTNNPKDSSSSSSLKDSSSSIKESSRNRINLVTNVPGSVKLKPMSLSLHGLLEYDENDVFEKTFEVSLFGELFNDMLKREFGATILHALDLYSKRRSNALTSNEPPAKKQKLDEADTISNTNSNDSEEKPLISTTEDTALLRAMDFFDKHGHGYLRPDEMETILYCLGKSLCKRIVEELVDKVIDPDSGRILYKKMIEDRTLFGHELF